jgi:CubicO group peptidase (beta-lactamase class C family)
MSMRCPAAWFAGVIASLALGCQPALAEAVPVFSPTGPDAAAYGAAEGFPVGTVATMGSQRTMVGAYSHSDQIRPVRRIASPAVASRLDRAAQELSLRYDDLGQTRDVDDYLARHPVTGLLILRGSTILLERYHYARTDQDRFTTQSIGKTVVSLLLGVALAEGAIRSIDDPVSAYLPELAGTEPGRTPLAALLEMRSGLAFREAYDGKDDIAKLGRALMKPGASTSLDVVAMFNQRAAPPGTVFNYAGLDTELLGLVIARATHLTLSALLETRIWAPLGAEAPATWTLDARDGEVAYCCISAVLRDWGRLGAMLAADGLWNGHQIVPRDYLRAATSPKVLPTGGRRLSYGYQVWVLPGERRQFMMRGIAGQVILIDPQSRLVLVHTAVRPTATDATADAELLRLWNALVDQQGDQRRSDG